MAASKQYNVRLDDAQQMMLNELVKNLNESSPVKITVADVLRIGLENLYKEKISSDSNLH